MSSPGVGSAIGQFLFWDASAGAYYWAPTSSATASKQVLAWNNEVLQPGWLDPCNLPMQFQLVSGSRSTKLPVATPLIIGSSRVDVSWMYSLGYYSVVSATFWATLETSDGGQAAKLDLYDLDGSLSGGVGYITGATLSTTRTSPALVSAVLSGLDFRNVGFLQARLWTDGPNVVYATCTMARLDIIWS